MTEKEGVENLLLYFIRKSFEMGVPLENDFSDPKILEISKLVKMVGREKHRMDAFVRFRETKDGLYFATVAPDFNVLPLLIKHFKDRYANMQWIIYDTKRGYGIYYDLHSVTQVFLENTAHVSKKSNASQYFTAAEIAFEDLWKQYFKSTNIASRKNTRLNLQHVPKRYWKNLSEKSPH